jgi:hypothetical protein
MIPDEYKPSDKVSVKEFDIIDRIVFDVRNMMDDLRRNCEKEKLMERQAGRKEVFDIMCKKCKHHYHNAKSCFNNDIVEGFSATMENCPYLKGKSNE